MHAAFLPTTVDFNEFFTELTVPLQVSTACFSDYFVGDLVI